MEVFLTLDEVLALHSDQIDRYGGAHGIRDIGLLQSAISMPQAMFDGEFLHPSLLEMAGAYLFHIVQNHPMIDGNKRLGLATLIAFLGLNGIRLAASPEPLLELILGVAQGHTSKAEIAVFLQTNTEPS